MKVTRKPFITSCYRVSKRLKLEKRMAPPLLHILPWDCTGWGAAGGAADQHRHEDPLTKEGASNIRLLSSYGPRNQGRS